MIGARWFLLMLVFPVLCGEEDPHVRASFRLAQDGAIIVTYKNINPKHSVFISPPTSVSVNYDKLDGAHFGVTKADLSEDFQIEGRQAFLRLRPYSALRRGSSCPDKVSVRYVLDEDISGAKVNINTYVVLFTSGDPARVLDVIVEEEVEETRSGKE